MCMCVYTHKWVTLPYSRNWNYIVNQPYFNEKKIFKEEENHNNVLIRMLKIRREQEWQAQCHAG